ncbi:hypothetical protein DL96DRAFT_1690265 [Flagelloscypha sp. PMI_526]|nr:hypothetical protein DL96DRAFT_1690265 [Flagelloscypha sp. PMI_526]
MHTSFTILHVVLIIVMHFELEKRVQVQLGPQSETLSLYAQFRVIQVFLMAELFVTQKLFMHRLLVKHQTLTQSHDQYTSWLGLGSSVTALFKQRTARSGYRWIFLISSYLAASATMKITTAALFQLSPTTIIIPKAIEATSITPSFLTSIMHPPVIDEDHPTTTYYQPGEYMVGNLREAMVLEKTRLGTWERSLVVDSLVLHGNMLYDTLPQVANATGTANISGVVVNAACHSLSTKDFINFTSNTDDSGGVRMPLPWNLPRDQREYYQDGWRSSPLSPTGNSREVEGNSSLFPTFVVPFQSMYGIEDTQGNMLKAIPLNKLLISDIPQSTGVTPKIFVDEPAIISHDTKNLVKCPFGLDLDYYVFHTAWPDADVVNVSGRTPVDVPKRKDHSSLSELSLAMLSFTETPPFEIFELGGTNPTESAFAFACNSTLTSKETWLVDWTSFDLFANQHLGLSNHSTLPRVKLHDLENMIEDWAALNFYLYHKVYSLMKLGNIGHTSSVSVTVRAQVSQLQLRALPVFSGFAASLVMLAIAAIIVFTTPVHHSLPDEIGVLQLLWLSDVKLDLGRPEGLPTEANLRRAGLTTAVKLVHGLGAFRRQGKNNEM